MPSIARVALALGADDLVRGLIRLAIAALLIVGLAFTFVWASLGGLFGAAQGPVGGGALAEIPAEQLPAMQAAAEASRCPPPAQRADRPAVGDRAG